MNTPYEYTMNGRWVQAIIHFVHEQPNSILIVRILMFWYQRQSICAKWGKTTSQYFSIINGVGQSGVYRLNYLLFTWMIYQCA